MFFLPEASYFLFTSGKIYGTIMMQQREDSKPAVTHAAKQAIEYSWQQGCLPFAKEFIISRRRYVLKHIFFWYPYCVAA